MCTAFVYRQITETHNHLQQIIFPEEELVNLKKIKKSFFIHICLSSLSRKIKMCAISIHLQDSVKMT